MPLCVSGTRTEILHMVRTNRPYRYLLGFQSGVLYLQYLIISSKSSTQVLYIAGGQEEHQRIVNNCNCVSIMLLSR
jgi:hypothetical protein